MKKDIVINEPTPNPSKNNPNSYRFLCRYKDQHDGLKVKTTFPRWKSEKEAKSQRAQWLTDYGRNEGHFAPPDVKTPEPVKLLTFRQYAAVHLDFLDKNTKSKSHASTVNKLVEYFGDTIFADIKRVDNVKRSTTPDKNFKFMDVQGFYDWILKQGTPETIKEVELKNGKWQIKKTVITKPYEWSSINHFIKRLSAMNRKAGLDKIPDVVEINFKGFKKPHLENARKITITFGELETLLENTYKDNLKLEILGLFECGARLSELKSVQRKDFDVSELDSIGEVTNSKLRNDVLTTKRPVYFSKRIREEIYRYHNVTESEFEQMPPETFLFDTAELRTAWEGLRERVAIKYAEQGDVKTANKILNLQEKDFRTTHRTNLKNARIDSDFKDVQTNHNQDSITAKHYEHSDYEAINEEFQLYEDYSQRQRAKLQKTMTAAEPDILIPEPPERWNFSFLPTFRDTAAA